MPIGKDSITKRVAKIETVAIQTEESKMIEQTELAPKSEVTTAKKALAKNLPSKTVIANIAPETVTAIIGHKENTKFEKIGLGTELPYYLL